MHFLRLLLLTACFLTPCAALAEAIRVSRNGVTYSVFIVSPARTPLRLFARGNGQFRNAADIKRWAESHGETLIFATNAGMYRPDRAPVGLLISSRQLIQDINTSSGHGNFYLKPNGVFLVFGTAFEVLETEVYRWRPEILHATQSGPLLVLNNVIHPEFRHGSDSRVLRSAVGVTGKGSAVFAISEGPVNFYDFAVLFKERLDCPNALFLDGVVSKMYLPELGRLETDGDFSGLFAVFE